MLSRLLQLLLVGALVSLTMGQDNSNRTCSIHNLRKCTRLLRSYPDNPTLLARSSEDVARHMCRRYQISRRCIESILPHCSPQTRIRWEGVAKTIKYICEDNLKDFLSHQTCLSSSQITESMKQCNTTFRRDIRDLLSTLVGGRRRHRMGQICSILNRFLSCILVAVERHCGRPAAVWMEGLLGLQLEVVISSPYLNCRINLQRGTTKTPILTSSDLNLQRSETNTPILTSSDAGLKHSTTKTPILASSVRSTFQFTTQESGPPKMGHSKQKGAATVMLGAVLGSIFAILLIIAMVVLIVVCRKRGRKPTDQQVSFIQSTHGQMQPYNNLNADIRSSDHPQSNDTGNSVHGVNTVYNVPAYQHGVGIDNPTYMQATVVLSSLPATKASAPPHYSKMTEENEVPKKTSQEKVVD